jgi:hypothetical protein
MIFAYRWAFFLLVLLASSPTVLDIISLDGPAIVDALRPPSTTRQDHADLGSAHGQDAIRAMEGKGGGHPAELGCSQGADAVNLPRSNEMRGEDVTTVVLRYIGAGRSLSGRSAIVQESPKTGHVR